MMGQCECGSKSFFELEPEFSQLNRFECAECGKFYEWDNIEQVFRLITKPRGDGE